MTDKELTALVETDPEAGMTAVIEGYSGLLWKVASGLLQNQEDIRDCVSEAFSEFYLHRENYDPERGKLSGYLAVIARRRALRRREDNSRQAEAVREPPPAEDPFARLEQRSELDDALSRLEAQDEQILRMKYYHGMSAREIAASLGLPYETVKKRHQRSLKKLRRLLLALLVIAALLALAACGIIEALRRFGVVPGYGITTDLDSACYSLTEPVLYQDGPITVEVVSAALLSDRLMVHYRLSIDKTEYRLPEYDEFGRSTHRQLSYASEIFDPKGRQLGCYTYVSGPSSFKNGSLVYPEFDQLRYEGRYGLTQDTLDAIQESGDRTVLTLRILWLSCDGEDYGDIDLPITMERTSPVAMDGYAYLYDEEAGGIMLDSRLDGDTLFLDVYPLSNGTMRFSAGLTQPNRDIPDNPDLAEYVPVTIVGEDGTAYTAEPKDSFSLINLLGLPYYTYTFSGVKPGKYTLTLPYVYLLASQRDPEPLVWNLENCTFSDKKVVFPGGSFQTISIQRTDTPALEKEIGFDHSWKIAVRCELDNEAMTAVDSGLLPHPKAKPFLTFLSLCDFLLFGGPQTCHERTTGGMGYPEEPGGDLIFYVHVDENSMDVVDLAHVECPITDNFQPMCILYDRPFELEFEVRG